MAQWGINPAAANPPRSDVTALGDYDGDGKTDVGVWRGVNESTSGVWRWIRSSDGQIGSAQLGAGISAGDYPAQGDYDGDGKTDPAVFRTGASLGVFHVLGSQRGFFTVQWGWSSDSP